MQKLWSIYWENQYIGSVHAATQESALWRAEDRFGPIWGRVEARMALAELAARRRQPCLVDCPSCVAAAGPGPS